MEGTSEEHNFLLQAGDTKAIQQGQLSSFPEGLLEKISLCVKLALTRSFPKCFLVCSTSSTLSAIAQDGEGRGFL